MQQDFRQSLLLYSRGRRETEQSSDLLCLLEPTSALRHQDQWIFVICWDFQAQFHTLHPLFLHHLPPTFLKSNPVLCMQVTHVKVDVGVIGYDIRKRSAPNDTWIDGQPFGPAVQTCKL